MLPFWLTLCCVGSIAQLVGAREWPKYWSDRVMVCSILAGWQTFALVLDTEECSRYGFPPNVCAPSYFIGWCQLTELMSLSGGCQRVSLGPDSLEVGWNRCIVFPSPRRIVMTDSAGGRGPHSIAQGYSLGCPYSLSWL